MLNITQVSNIMKNLSQWFNQQWYQSESKPLILCALAKIYHMGQRLEARQAAISAPFARDCHWQYECGRYRKNTLGHCSL